MARNLPLSSPQGEVDNTVVVLDGTTGLPVPSGAPGSPTSVVTVVTGLSYTDVSIASLTANQANGVVAIFNVDITRKALVFNPPADCGLGLTSGGPAIWPLYANTANSFTGPECPTDALYLTAGLTAGQTLPIAAA